MSIKKIGIVIAIERELEAFLKSSYEIDELDSETFKCFRAIVKGNVTIGEDSSVWYNAVVRIENILIEYIVPCFTIS